MHSMLMESNYLMCVHILIFFFAELSENWNSSAQQTPSLICIGKETLEKSTFGVPDIINTAEQVSALPD